MTADNPVRGGAVRGVEESTSPKWRWMLALPFVGLGLASPARAQDTLAAPSPRDSVLTAPEDTVRRPPVKPLGALWRSFLIPGWGQAKLGRRLTGGIFVAWEGVTVAMTIKTSRELGYLRRTNSARVDAKRKERQDWLVLLAFNHLLAGLEAYVSSHLWDFPGDLQLRALPGGGVGGQLSIPVRVP